MSTDQPSQPAADQFPKGGDANAPTFPKDDIPSIVDPGFYRDNHGNPLPHSGAKGGGAETKVSPAAEAPSSGVEEEYHPWGKMNLADRIFAALQGTHYAKLYAHLNKAITDIVEAEFASRLAASEESLRRGVAEITSQRDRLAEEAMKALAGITCTPEEGFIPVPWHIGTCVNELKRDLTEARERIRELRKALGEAIDQIDPITETAICRLKEVLAATAKYEEGG